MAYLKHQGGTRSQPCNDITRDTYDWCERKRIWLFPAFIPGIQNVEADYESRHFSDDTEWMLNTNIFHEACEAWGKPHIDLFASRNNSQLQMYASWCPDPCAKFTDAFSETGIRLTLCMFSHLSDSFHEYFKRSERKR